MAQDVIRLNSYELQIIEKYRESLIASENKLQTVLVGEKGCEDLIEHSKKRILEFSNMSVRDLLLMIIVGCGEDLK